MDLDFTKEELRQDGGGDVNSRNRNNDNNNSKSHSGEETITKEKATPPSVAESEWLPATPRLRLYFKCENLQKVGAFKARGAFHAVERLKTEAAMGMAGAGTGATVTTKPAGRDGWQDVLRKRGLITHSSGKNLFFFFSFLLFSRVPVSLFSVHLYIRNGSHTFSLLFPPFLSLYLHLFLSFEHPGALGAWSFYFLRRRG